MQKKKYIIIAIIGVIIGVIAYAHYLMMGITNHYDPMPNIDTTDKIGHIIGQFDKYAEDLRKRFSDVSFEDGSSLVIKETSVVNTFGDTIHAQKGITDIEIYYCFFEGGEFEILRNGTNNSGIHRIQIKAIENSIQAMEVIVNLKYPEQGTTWCSYYKENYFRDPIPDSGDYKAAHLKIMEYISSEELFYMVIRMKQLEQNINDVYYMHIK